MHYVKYVQKEKNIMKPIKKKKNLWYFFPRYFLVNIFLF